MRSTLGRPKTWSRNTARRLSGSIRLAHAATMSSGVAGLKKCSRHSSGVLKISYDRPSMLACNAIQGCRRHIRIDERSILVGGVDAISTAAATRCRHLIHGDPIARTEHVCEVIDAHVQPSCAGGQRPVTSAGTFNRT